MALITLRSIFVMVSMGIAVLIVTLDDAKSPPGTFDIGNGGPRVAPVNLDEELLIRFGGAIAGHFHSEALFGLAFGEGDIAKGLKAAIVEIILFGREAVG